MEEKKLKAMFFNGSPRKKVLGEIFGYSETLYVYNTYQFSDYSRYDFNAFSEEDKRKYRDEHYDIDLKNAYELGKRLVQKVQL